MISPLPQVDLICVNCPIGCNLTVQLNQHSGHESSKATGELKITGHQCKAGIAYAKEEITNPTRNIATSVRITGGDMPMLSVKTAKPIPKGAIFDVIKAVHAVTMIAPVEIGDTVLADAAGYGVNIVATRRVALRQ